MDDESMSQPSGFKPSQSQTEPPILFHVGSLGNSIQSSQRLGTPELSGQNFYGTVQETKMTSNPFVGPQVLEGHWSSGKSRVESEQQLSFGGTKVGPVNLAQGENSQASLNSTPSPQSKDTGYEAQMIAAHEQQTSLVDKLMTKAYNQGLVQMGEKAAVRYTLKEVCATLDTLNELMCKQMVQQDIVLNEDTPSSQLKQIMSMPLVADKEEKLGNLKRKNNM